MSLDKLVSDIFVPHHEEVKDYIVRDILGDIIDIVLDRIYSDVNSGKIRIEGVLSKDQIFADVIKKMKVKGEING